MTDPVTWAAVGMAAVSNMATWLIIIKGRNEAKKNADNGAGPGTGKICRERGEKIAIIETRQNRFDKDIEEIKGDLKAIREAVEK